MEAALYDPQDGYYCQKGRERWGRSGDYRTSPERSPLFAATFARYFAKLYEELKAPSRWSIVEVGAGSGHFAAGVLATLQRHFPNVFLATRYVIDEASMAASALARTRLAQFGSCVEFEQISDMDRLDSAVVFANELLDAFPVHRFTNRQGELREL